MRGPIVVTAVLLSVGIWIGCVNSQEHVRPLSINDEVSAKPLINSVALLQATERQNQQQPVLPKVPTTKPAVRRASHQPRPEPRVETQEERIKRSQREYQAQLQSESSEYHKLASQAIELRGNFTALDDAGSEEFDRLVRRMEQIKSSGEDRLRRMDVVHKEILDDVVHIITERRKTEAEIFPQIQSLDFWAKVETELTPERNLFEQYLNQVQAEEGLLQMVHDFRTKHAALKRNVEFMQPVEAMVEQYGNIEDLMVLSAYSNDPSRIYIRVSRHLDPFTAIDPQNFEIKPSVEISYVEYKRHSKFIILNLKEQLQAGERYEIIIRQLYDSQMQPVMPGSIVGFVFPSDAPFRLMAADDEESSAKLRQHMQEAVEARPAMITLAHSLVDTNRLDDARYICETIKERFGSSNECSKAEELLRRINELENPPPLELTSAHLRMYVRDRAKEFVQSVPDEVKLAFDIINDRLMRQMFRDPRKATTPTFDDLRTLMVNTIREVDPSLMSDVEKDRSIALYEQFIESLFSDIQNKFSNVISAKPEDIQPLGSLNDRDAVTSTAMGLSEGFAWMPPTSPEFQERWQAVRRWIRDQRKK